MPAPEHLRQHLSTWLVGTDADERATVVESTAVAMPAAWHGQLRRMLSTAIDMAFVDLVGRRFDLPAYELFGGRRHLHLPISWVAFIRETSDLESDVRGKVRKGFRAFKLKVGQDFADDCERVSAIRRIIGTGGYLKVDASGSWEEQEAIENIRRLTALGANAVETPLQAASRSLARERPEVVSRNADSAAVAIARVRRAVSAKIIEHVVDFSDEFALALIRHGSVDMFNVVVSQAGSLSCARRLMHLAEAAGLQVLLGSTVELGPGTAAALHVGVASRAVTATSDLVGPGLLEDDVIQIPFAYDNGRLSVPRRSGLGVTLDAEKLRRYHVARPGAAEQPHDGPVQ